MADIVNLNYVVAELDQATVPKLRPIRDRYINVENPPASTFFVVTRLMRPGWLIEIEAGRAVFWACLERTEGGRKTVRKTS
jgi:enamine deaminase RidA (YjgF/YER057c/UK114 family)